MTEQYQLVPEVKVTIDEAAMGLHPQDDSDQGEVHIYIRRDDTWNLAATASSEGIVPRTEDPWLIEQAVAFVRKYSKNLPLLQNPSAS